MRYFYIYRRQREMSYKFSDLKQKEVIHIKNGERLGFVSDIEIDDDGKVTSISVPGAYKAFGLLGKEDDKTIEWNRIKKIGDDLVMIE